MLRGGTAEQRTAHWKRREMSLSLSALICVAAASAGKNIHISLSAPWPKTDLRAEALAYFAQHHTHDSFYKFATSLPTNDTRLPSDKLAYEQALSAAKSLLKPLTLKVFSAHLVTGVHSPKVEMWRNLEDTERSEQGVAPEVLAWLRVCDRSHTFFSHDLAHVEAIIDKAIVDASSPDCELPNSMEELALSASAPLSVDVVYGSQSFGSVLLKSPLLVLYAPLGTQVLLNAHNILSAASDNGAVTYVYRPLIRGDTASRVERQPVQGFGVELAIKNMEYKAMDEKEAASNADEQGVGTTVEEDAAAEEAEEHGLFFQTLAARNPELKDSLTTLREALRASEPSEDGSNLKLWAMKDLGLQAAARVLRAHDPLRTLREVTQNFPLLARSLSRTAVPRRIREDVERTQNELWGEGFTGASLNGRHFDIDGGIDISKLLVALGNEAAVLDSFMSFNLSASTLKALRSVPVPDSGMRVRAEADTVVYANDVEKDKRYNRFSMSLKALLRPSMFGQMSFCKRNVFTAIFVVDPATESGLEVLNYAQDLMDNNIPLRFGFVFAPPSLPSTSPTRSLASRSRQVRLDSLGAEYDDLDAEHAKLLAAVEKRSLELEDAATVSEISESSDADAMGAGESSEAVSCGRLLTKLFHFLQRTISASKAMKFLLAVKQVRQSDGGFFGPPTYEPLTEAHLLRAFQHIAHGAKNINPSDYEQIRKSTESEWDEAADAGATYIKNKGLGSQPLMLMNGSPVHLSDSGFEQEIIQALNDEMRKIQSFIRSGTLSDDDKDLLEKVGTLTPTFPRLNQALLLGPNDLEILNLMPHAALELLEWVEYSPVDDGTFHKLNLILVLDLTVAADVRVAASTMQAFESPLSGKSRFSVLHCPRKDSKNHRAEYFHRIARAWQKSAASEESFPRLKRLLASLHTVALASGLDVIPPRLLDAYELSDQSTFSESMTSMQMFCAEHQVGSDGAAIIANGRVVRLKNLPTLDSTDVKLLIEFELSQRANGVSEVLSKIDPPDNGSAWQWHSNMQMFLAAAAARAASVTSDVASTRGRDHLSMLARAPCNDACIQVDGSGNGAALELVVALDPLKKDAQRISAILESLHRSLGISVTLHLSPRLDISDFPLKSFYRYVFDVEPHFLSSISTTGQRESFAIFSSLRTLQVLTLHVDAPEAWLIECVEAAYDMDNIRLGDLGGRRTLFASYEIKSLLLTGSCEDVSSEMKPPNGLQLYLGNGNVSNMADTLVMSNLGYFQLKALPGVWSLALAPGISSKIYQIVASTGLLSMGHSMEAARRARLKMSEDFSPVPRLRVILSSFSGENTLLLVEKRDGMEGKSVLDKNAASDKGENLQPDVDDGSGMLSNWFSSSGLSTKSSSKDGDIIHIFSLASGHLYERFLKIMMQSVLDRTERRVKFWLLKNFLSPAFINFLPTMARELGFEYGLVQYQWPTWLHKQTEKQRIIWGYKILFLDVMFPLSVRKIIYIDADQVVNADVGELWDMKLGGAAIGMTPFCNKDANQDTLGFRFFAQGYWKNHLAGKPYHISALFVVDLHKFRRRAYGDQYRIVYDSLSKDPNSLSNLDQDLPNFAQYQVPIKSLPESWLWCEAWCGNSSKPQAKTIDLCNNPLTKEPKLNQATRIIGDRWTKYDRRSKELEEIALERSDSTEAVGSPRDEL